MYDRDKIVKVFHEIKDEASQIRPFVLVAQPRRDEKEVAAQNFAGGVGVHIDLLGCSTGYVSISGEKVDVARNYLLEAALESQAKYLLFVGEDTVVPYDGFKKLLKTAEKNPRSVVAGVYYIKCSDAMIMTKGEDNSISVPDVSPGQIIEAWQTGMDIMLIPRELLLEMKEEDPEVPFCCIAFNIEDIPFIGEDNFFVYRLRKLGWKLLVNTDVQCLHMDLATGNYTAHPSVEDHMYSYYTNIPIGRPLTMEDKRYIDDRWVSRIPAGSAGVNSLNDQIADRQKENAPVKLNIGAGRRCLDGYINIDKLSNDELDVVMDVFSVDFPEHCVDEILGEHFLEHIPQHQVPPFLKKCFKALKSQGRIVLEMPDVEKLFDEYKEADEVRRRELLLCIYGAYVEDINNPECQRNGALSPHLWGFSKASITEYLENAGFSDIRVEVSTSEHPGHNMRVTALKGEDDGQR